MKELISESLEATRAIAKQWLDIISDSTIKRDEALVVGLSGHLGAGKTAYVKAVADVLGIQETVTSPTFVIMKIYSTTNPRWKKLIHIDAYRLEKSEELQAIDFEKYISDPSNLIMIEWPENVNLEKIVKYLPIKFEMNDGRMRVTFY